MTLPSIKVRNLQVDCFVEWWKPLPVGLEICIKRLELAEEAMYADYLFKANLSALSGCSRLKSFTYRCRAPLSDGEDPAFMESLLDENLWLDPDERQEGNPEFYLYEGLQVGEEGWRQKFSEMIKERILNMKPQLEVEISITKRSFGPQNALITHGLE